MIFPGVRHFILPTNINFASSDYFEMIDFDKVQPSWITESPLTKTYTENWLVNFVNRERLVLPDIPCHSQNMERVVADVTQVSLHANSYEKRQEKLLMTFASQRQVSAF